MRKGNNSMAIKPTPKFCIRCGSPIKPGEKFCMNCGAQLVRNLYDKTPIEPTKIEPTEVKPTEIEPTKIEPTKIEPTEIKHTEIKPIEIEPTPIEPTPIEPTPIKLGVFNNRFFMFFIQPNVLIWGIIALGSTLFHTISVTCGGFNWWNIFTLLLMLGSLFEVVWGVIKAPISKTNPDGSPKSKGRMLGDKMKYIFKGNGPKPSPKNLVGVIGGGISVLAIIIYLFGSLISGFKNHVVLDGYTFRYSYEAYGYNPETDYETVTFYTGYKAKLVHYSNNIVTRTYNCDYWRIGDGCGVISYEYVEPDGTVVKTPDRMSNECDTTNWDIKSATHLQSGGCHFYRTN